MAWNLITNFSFETGDPPSDWTAYIPGGGSFARSDVQKKVGTYSGLLTNAAANTASAYQTLTTTIYQNKLVSFGAWAYATDANRVRLAISGDVSGFTYSAYHSGAAGWEWLTVSKVMGADTFVRGNCIIESGDAISAYFDYVFLIDGRFGTWIRPIVEIAFSSNPFDASPTWDDLTADLLAFSINRGRQYELDKFEAGTATVTLLNTSGNYWPNNTGGDYSPNVDINKRVKISAFWQGLIYNVYVGYTKKFTPKWGLPSLRLPIMEIECYDALALISKYFLNNAGYAQEDSGARVTNVLDDVGFPAADRAIDTGVFTMQATGALVNQNAFDHLVNVATSELGLFFINRSGYAVFENMGHRNAHSSTITFDTNYPDVGLSLDDVLFYNQVRATRTGGTEQVQDDATTNFKQVLVRSGLLHSNDTATFTYSGYLFSRYAGTAIRAQSLTVKPYQNPATLIDLVLALDISSKITLTVPSPSNISGDYFIERVEMGWSGASPAEWTIHYQLSEVNRYYPLTERTETYRPNAAGDLAEWAGSNYQAMADSNDQTNMNTTNIEVDKRSLFKWAGLPYTNANIAQIQLFGRITRILTVGGGTNGYAYPIIKTNATIYNGTSVNCTNIYANISHNWNVNPATNAAWNLAALNNMQIGVAGFPPLLGGALDGTTFCSEVCVNVQFTPLWS